MLSMSTRKHEYGRQTRDEAAEVKYFVLHGQSLLDILLHTCNTHMHHFPGI